MQIADLFRLALAALWQQKTRSLLTMLGVILGSCMLAMSLSVGTGVQEVVRNEFRKNDRLRRIEIYPGLGEALDDEAGIPPEAIAVTGNMSPERRQRLRKLLVRHWHDLNLRRALPLTRSGIDQLRAIEHVEEVVPAWYETGRITIGGRTIERSLRSTQYGNRGLERQIVAGSMPADKDSHGIVVHEFVLYQLGYHDDADVQKLLGQPIQIEIADDWRSARQLLSLFDAQPETLTTEEIRLLEKVLRLLPSALETLDVTPAEKEQLRRMMQRQNPNSKKPAKVSAVEEFTLAGVFRAPDDEELKRQQFNEYYFQYVDVVVPYESGARFCERLPRRQEGGFDSLTVYVDKEENVQAVVDQVHATGVRHYSAVEFVDQVLREVRLIRYSTTFLAGIALLVAGLGITNTMVTSVLERMQEIGIMKAVGARDRHVQLMFLLEGMILGLLGGGFGLLSAWLISLPADGYARKLMEQQTKSEVQQSLFVFPIWLALAVPLFAILITTLAAVYPARRASRVDPITALRHE